MLAKIRIIEISQFSLFHYFCFIIHISILFISIIIVNLQRFIHKAYPDIVL